MAKRIENDYRLSNAESRFTKEQLEQILSDFEYFCANCQQIVDKNGKLGPLILNRPQKVLAKRLLPMVMKETRLDQRHNVVVLKCRQMGASTELVVLINYICAFVDGINNMNLLHVFPVGDAGGKFYKNKAEPIITGVHPFIYPQIEQTFTSSTSKVITYHNTKGARRNNSYEIVSANASSIRGATVQVALLDEVADYTRPYDLEAALSPAIPDYGFSLVVFLSTFSDKRSDYFLEKIKLAKEDPEGWTLIFIPWYMMYPEKRVGITLESLKLTEYDENVIIPALQADNIPQDEWGDCIAWYHRKEREVAKMKQEYPTTIDEVLKLGANERLFSDEEIANAEAKVMPDKFYTLLTDPLTGKVEAKEAEEGNCKIFRSPQYGHRYMLIADPITSVGDKSDFFAASMFDIDNNEQVATLHGRGLNVEDWAVLSHTLARLYNRALICPESNLAEAFKTTIWNMGYYNWYYATPGNRAKRDPGLRTTATSKPRMLEKLQLLLRNNRIILHDKDYVEELKIFEKQVKKNNGTVTFAAPNGKHDDRVAVLWIYAGTLDINQFSERKERKTVFACG